MNALSPWRLRAKPDGLGHQSTRDPAVIAEHAITVLDEWRQAAWQIDSLVEGEVTLSAPLTCRNRDQAAGVNRMLLGLCKDLGLSPQSKIQCHAIAQHLHSLDCGMSIVATASDPSLEVFGNALKDEGRFEVLKSSLRERAKRYASEPKRINSR